MKKNTFLKLGIMCLLNVFMALAQPTTPNLKTDSLPKPASQSKDKSLEAFKTVLSVIKSPRCINCHPTGDRPLQGDDHHEHIMNVQRGLANQGGVVQKCNTCHQKENMAYSRVPGAPKWGLAPKSMGWFGLSDNQIAQTLMDKSKNGGRSPKDLVQHMAFDSLVMWAWQPGSTRTLPPVSVDEFRVALNLWLDNGAYIPQN